MASIDIAIFRLRQECNRAIKKINMGLGVRTPGFHDINRLLKLCDVLFAAHRAQKSENANLREALRKWKCDSCGGSGQYHNRWRDANGFVDEMITCKRCGGSGLHPIAQEALDNT